MFHEDKEKRCITRYKSVPTKWQCHISRKVLGGSAAETRCDLNKESMTCMSLAYREEFPVTSSHDMICAVLRHERNSILKLGSAVQGSIGQKDASPPQAELGGRSLFKLYPMKIHTKARGVRGSSGHCRSPHLCSMVMVVKSPRGFQPLFLGAERRQHSL